MPWRMSATVALVAVRIGDDSARIREVERPARLGDTRLAHMPGGEHLAPFRRDLGHERGDELLDDDGP